MEKRIPASQQLRIAAHFLRHAFGAAPENGRLSHRNETAVPSPSLSPESGKVVSSSESEGDDIDVNRASRWLIASAVVVFVCGVLATLLPLTFSVGVAALLGWLFVFAAIAHLVFGIHFESGTLGWHAFIAVLYGLAAINLLVNPLLGVVLLAFVVRQYRHAVWILVDGVFTLGLGIVACAHWPPASLELVQYLVGISFISSGISRLLLGFAVRLIEPTERPHP
jgi:uncharacterized membrane protein HdeD (DUF308 family)